MLECGEAQKSSLLAVTVLYVVCRSLAPLSNSLNDLQISHVCIYVYGDFSLTIQILSNMETKLSLVLHVDHKPLNIKNDSIKSVEKCKRYSTFCPAPPFTCVCLQSSLYLPKMAASWQVAATF